MKKIISSALIVAVSLGMSGCAPKRLGQFTMATSKNVSGIKYTDSNLVEGEECEHTILFFTNEKDDMLQRAMDNTIDEANKRGLKGNLLIDTRIELSHLNFIVYGQDCIHVKGKLVEVK